MRQLMFVYMLEPLESNKRFTQWPLHVTLLPWFETDDIETVKAELRQVAASTPAMNLKTTERAHFGARRLPVMLIEDSRDLRDLHEKLLDITVRYGWELEGRYTGDNYLPHVTQKGGRDAPEEFRLDSLYLVESLAMGYRQVLDRVNLSRE